MNQIDDASNASLRTRGLMTEDEVAYTQGDLLVSVNVLTNEKRILGKSKELISESINRRVLKG